MRKRSASMLFSLLPGSGVIPALDKLAGLHQVSQRTLRADLEEINNFLTTIGQPHYFVNYLGLVQSRGDPDPVAIREALVGIGKASYKLAPDERQYLILAALLGADGYTTMESLAEALLVTRVTVLSDIEFIKAFLEDYSGIDLETRSSKGVRLAWQGERQCRSLLLDILRKVVVKIGEDTVFLHIMARELGIKHDLSEIAAILRRFEMERDILIPEEGFADIALSLLVALNRHLAGHELEPSGEANAVGADDSLAAILRLALTKTGIAMSADQQVLTVRDMAAGGLSVPTRKILDIELYNVITYFLSKVGERFGAALHGDLLLVESLHKHIKSMSDAMDLGFDFAREKEFQGEYWEILEEINKHSHLLEKYLGRTLSERMKLSIFVHICAALVRNRKFLSPLGVLVVCPGSMATGRLVEAQVKNFFDFTIRDVVPADRLAEALAAAAPAVDFVIATVPVQAGECPVVTVRPVLTMDDFNQIQKTAFAISRAHNKKDGVKGRVVRLVEQALDTVDDNRQGELINGLKELAGRYAPKPSPEGPGLADLLDPANIRLVDGEMTWRDAMRLGGGVLRDAGYMAESYIDEMIANVAEYGPYIIIGGRIALAHAKPDGNVTREGLSLVVARDGIVFDGGERVHPMLCLSIRGDREYIGHFRQIVRLSESGGFIEDLLAASSGDAARDVILAHCGEV